MDVYPFGLTMAGISSKALSFGKENKRGYAGNEIQNKEFSDGYGLDFYDFNARTYYQQIGRFIQIDPLSEEAEQEGWSPYHYSYDNPVTYSDPDGRCPCLIVPIIQAITAAVAAGTTTYVVVKSYENSDLDLNLNLSIPAATGTGTARPVMGGSAAQLDFAVERQLNNVTKDFAKNSTSQGAAAGGAGAQTGKVFAKSRDKKPDGIQGVQNGVIYEVPGTHTKSGKPYIGRTKNPDPAKRRSDGGRDRKKAKVVDTYNPGNVQEARVKEQKKIDEKGLENLDNKRNEIKPQKKPNT